MIMFKVINMKLSKILTDAILSKSQGILRLMWDSNAFQHLFRNAIAQGGGKGSPRVAMIFLLSFYTNMARNGPHE